MSDVKEALGAMPKKEEEINVKRLVQWFLEHEETIRKALTDSLWQPIETAPKDGSTVRLKLGDMTLLAHWENIFVDDEENQCGGWVANNENEHPPCWTDGACWQTNEYDYESMQPTAWKLPEKEQKHE